MFRALGRACAARLRMRSRAGVWPCEIAFSRPEVGISRVRGRETARTIRARSIFQTVCHFFRGVQRALSFSKQLERFRLGAWALQG